MKTRMIEIRDHATCIPAMAVLLWPENMIENRFVRRCGYAPSDDSVILVRLEDGSGSSDPHGWVNNRTMSAAHQHLAELARRGGFAALHDGQVIDVRVLLGEGSEPAPAEIWT